MLNFLSDPWVLKVPLTQEFVLALKRHYQNDLNFCFELNLFGYASSSFKNTGRAG